MSGWGTLGCCGQLLNMSQTAQEAKGQITFWGALTQHSLKTSFYKFKPDIFLVWHGFKVNLNSWVIHG